MGPNHVAADVRGIATGCQGRGLRSVRNCQLVDSLPAHIHLHALGGQLWPVRTLPLVYDCVRALFALQRHMHPRDSWSLAGGDRELFSDRAHLHHQATFHCAAELIPQGAIPVPLMQYLVVLGRVHVKNKINPYTMKTHVQ